ncbi:tRNA (adenosine(37)-N6)-threonylcarbamoyltransferase complex dimerization subunit type 1 TsaB [Leucobacter chromiiresistens]|uniref:tRNA threonylcarbamoyl adenosine modification protein YeaZ n=2 Tax=Leucobacter chromiiresistens TaxID=1079994 RepID=A0A1H1BHT7_9MICO|nr:tRNA (adenosine(37)-N6)-threonylcarbamoyltransferase complex dimerization subunit type 1 TsaB [Leucobacter chromiiresistens]SDQ51502.1 tRNA threonylcarbamoyl adenosine modification protein YeaZ [Leucobacter chromiiresistens]
MSTTAELFSTACDTGDHVLLAIDTAIGTTVALGAAGRVHVAVSDDPRGHAEAIGSLLDEVFRAADAAPSRVSGVVAGIGPGPFTGLRVGIAAAHAFALGRGVPLLPVPGHAAVALDACEGGATGPLRVVQDARRRELFVTEFAGLDDAGLPVVSAGPLLVARSEYVEQGGDLWPERIPGAALVRLAVRSLEAGRPFADDRALYLRAPDVAQPGAPKRVST